MSSCGVLQKNEKYIAKNGDIVISEILTNHIFISVIAAMVFCELWKFIDSSFREKRIDWGALIATGGMPSSHATFVCSIATAIGFAEGFASTIFLLSIGFAIVVVRDAFGVRRDVDMLAKTTNDIIRKGKLSMKSIMKITGHTPVQVVVGSIIGIIIPIILQFLVL